MSDCDCHEVLDGNSATDGGGGVAAGWTCVYELDLRDVAVADLNSIGSSFTHDGVTWLTPTVGNSGADMVTTATAFGITANGLEVDAAVGGDLSSNNPTAAHIYANLDALGANTRTPFEADPTRAYLIQAYVSVFSPAADFDEAAVMLYKVTDVPVTSGNNITWASLARISAVTDTPSMVAGPNGTLTRLNRTDLPPTVYDMPTLHYVGTGHSVDAYTGQFAPSWAANEDLRFVGSFADDVEVGLRVVGDPVAGMRIGLGFEGHGGAGVDATIQRVRICQF